MFILKLAKIIIKHLENPDKVANLLVEFGMLGQNSGNYCISLFTKFILGEINIILNKYSLAKNFFYYVKGICNQYNFIAYKLLCYKKIGICYMHQKQYMKAKNNFAKMLTIALTLNDFKNELYSYDYIGL